MPALTHRRDPNAHQETWLIYYGDVHIGTIVVRSGIIANEPNQVEHPTGQIGGKNNEGPCCDSYLAYFECCRRSRMPDLLNGRRLHKGVP
jgi:hypothetical protein